MQRLVFRVVWFLTVVLPGAAIAAIALCLITSILSRAEDRTFGLLFGSAALLFTLASLSLSAARAHEAQTESQWDFRQTGVRMMQAGYLVSVGSALSFASYRVSEWGTFLVEGSAVMSLVRAIGDLATGGGIGVGAHAFWLLGGALWTSQYENWLPCKRGR
jgi:hypothetical protein